MWTYVHREFLTIFGQCINVLNYNPGWPSKPVEESKEPGKLGFNQALKVWMNQ